jgi:hypothetical protein
MTVKNDSALSSIHQADRFCIDNSERLQRNLRVSYLLMTLNYWLTIRLAFIGNTMVRGGAAL